MFLSCGDSLFDMFVAEQAGDKQLGTDAGTADNTRIAISGVVGGSPMNVALGLARMGHSSRYLTKLSNDIFGQRIARFLDNNQIDRTLSAPTDLNTTLAMVETADDGAAQYVFYIHNSADVSLAPAELPEKLPDAVQVVHFGSYSTAVEPCAEALKQLAERESSGRIISYDPNLRMSIEPNVETWRSSFARFCATANLVKASDEDIESLYGAGQEEKFVADCFDHGAQLVYITRGPNGGSAFDSEGGSAQADGVNVKVVDTVGAGDTFQAAILHWLATENHLNAGASIEGRVDLQASLAFATRAAAITCTRRGADLPGLADLA